MWKLTLYTWKKKNKRQNKKQKTLEKGKFYTKEESLNLYQPETEKKNEVIYNDEKEFITIMPLFYNFFG